MVLTDGPRTDDHWHTRAALTVNFFGDSTSCLGASFSLDPASGHRTCIAILQRVTLDERDGRVRHVYVRVHVVDSSQVGTFSQKPIFRGNCFICVSIKTCLCKVIFSISKLGVRTRSNLRGRYRWSICQYFSKYKNFQWTPPPANFFYFLQSKKVPVDSGLFRVRILECKMLQRFTSVSYHGTSQT